MHAAVLRPLINNVLSGGAIVVLIPSLFEIIDELLYAPPRRGDEVDGIRAWVLLALLLEYLRVIDAGLVQLEPLAAAGEDPDGAEVEDHDQVVSAEIGVVLHRLDHLVEDPLLGVGAQ